MREISLRKLMLGCGRSQSDLSRLLGSRSRASEYLNGKRSVSLRHRILLVSEWGVPAADAMMLGRAEK